MPLNHPRRTFAAIALAAPLLVLSAAVAGGVALLAGAPGDRQPEKENSAEERIPSVADTPRTSWKQMHRLAVQLDAGAYMSVRENAVLFSNGEAVDYSGRDESGVHESGTTLDTGVWLFPANSVIQWPEGEVQILRTDSVIVPPSDLNVQGAVTDKGTSIECEGGFYACCNIDNVSCVRKAEIDHRTCQSGGEGARACSFSDSI